MSNIPSDIIAEIIDKLAEPDPAQPRAPCGISSYSLVSRGWVYRTQKHHFKYVRLDSHDKMDKWVEKIDPDELGLSKYVRSLSFSDIESLEGFKTHIRAFTQVTDAEMWDCSLLMSPDSVRIFTESLGRNLVQLELLNHSKSTPEIMVSLLAGLPKLRMFCAVTLTVERDLDAPAPSSEGIPFFECGEGRFNVALADANMPGQFCWVPPTAICARVGLDAASVACDLEFVNQLVSTSGETLTHFILDGSIYEPPPGDVDFSNSPSLTTLYFPILLDDPYTLANSILPSITSSRLSKVVLVLNDMWSEEFNPEGWAELELILSRLKKRLATMHRIDVTMAVDTSRCDKDLADQFFGEPLVSSFKEVGVEIWKEKHDHEEFFLGFEPF